MVNPYSLNSNQRGLASKPQIQLGQSQALKKFEKFQNKYTTSVERKNIIIKNTILDTFKDDDDDEDNQFVKKKNFIDDDDDDDDDDSLFKSKKKFIKNKKEPQVTTQTQEQQTKDDLFTFSEFCFALKCETILRFQRGITNIKGVFLAN